MQSQSSLTKSVSKSTMHAARLDSHKTDRKAYLNSSNDTELANSQSSSAQPHSQNKFSKLVDNTQASIVKKNTDKKSSDDILNNDSIAGNNAPLEQPSENQIFNFGITLPMSDMPTKQEALLNAEQINQNTGDFDNHIKLTIENNDTELLNPAQPDAPIIAFDNKNTITQNLSGNDVSNADIIKNLQKNLQMLMGLNEQNSNISPEPLKKAIENIQTIMGAINSSDTSESPTKLATDITAMFNNFNKAETTDQNAIINKLSKLDLTQIETIKTDISTKISIAKPIAETLSEQQATPNQASTVMAANVATAADKIVKNTPLHSILTNDNNVKQITPQQPDALNNQQQINLTNDNNAKPVTSQQLDALNNQQQAKHNTTSKILDNTSINNQQIQTATQQSQLTSKYANRYNNETSQSPQEDSISNEDTADQTRINIAYNSIKTTTKTSPIGHNQSSLEKVNSAIPMDFLNQLNMGDAQLATKIEQINPNLAGHENIANVKLAHMNGRLAQNLPVNAMAFQIGKQFNNGKNEFQIRLDPAELGRVNVKLSFKKAGAIKAHMVVERSDVFELMQRDARALEKALSDAGFDGKNVEIDLSLNQNNNGSGSFGEEFDNQNNQSNQNHHNNQTSKDDEMVQMVANPVPLHVSSTGIDRVI